MSQPLPRYKTANDFGLATDGGVIGKSDLIAALTIEGTRANGQRPPAFIIDQMAQAFYERHRQSLRDRIASHLGADMRKPYPGYHRRLNEQRADEAMRRRLASLPAIVIGDQYCRSSDACDGETLPVAPDDSGCRDQPDAL